MGHTNETALITIYASNEDCGYRIENMDLAAKYKKDVIHQLELLLEQIKSIDESIILYNTALAYAKDTILDLKRLNVYLETGRCDASFGTLIEAETNKFMKQYDEKIKSILQRK